MINKTLMGAALLLCSVSASADNGDITTNGEANIFPGAVSNYLEVPHESSSSSYRIHYASLTGLASDGRNVVMVHGMAGDQDAFRPMAEGFATTTVGKVNAVHGLDLPGHGFSGWPTNERLGDITLDDYVDALDALLKKLDADSGIPGNTVLIGHSMGGIVVQSLAERLERQGLSLDARGVHSVALFASTLPQQVRWSGGLNPSIYTTMTRALTYNDTNGCLAQFSNDDPDSKIDMIATLFTDRYTGELYDGDLPSTEEADFFNNAQPCAAGFEMMGLDSDLDRPEVGEGILTGVKALVAGFQGDEYILPNDVQRLYQYLTGMGDNDCTGSLTQQAVHVCAMLAGPHYGIWTVPTDPNEAFDPYMTWILD